MHTSIGRESAHKSSSKIEVDEHKNNYKASQTNHDNILPRDIINYNAMFFILYFMCI